jgi:hypothetical protein
MTIFNLPDFHPNEHPVPSTNRIVSLQASLKKKVPKQAQARTAPLKFPAVFTHHSQKNQWSYGWIYLHAQ